MKEISHKGLRTWIEVDRGVIKQNYQIFRGLIPKKTKLMAVVKSNAYGHSLVDFAREMEKLGADFLGVDSVVEGLTLREEGVRAPILILGYTLPERLKEAAEADLSVTVSTFETLSAIEKLKLAKPLKIHIKVDTGMHRQGFLAEDLSKVLKILDSRPARPAGGFMIHDSPSTLRVEGLYTHFAAAKNPSFPKDTRGQLDFFKTWTDAFEKAGIKPVVHAAATAGAILFPESHFDMVRIGIGLYGLWPAGEVEAFAKDRLKLESALSWRTIISEVKQLPKGSKIGYDFTESLQRESVVAICPVGYWHGLPRALSSIGRVLVRGSRARILGRVSMDMIAIDVTDCPKASIGDVVTLIGKDGKEEIRATELASLTDSSHYEIVTRLNPLIKRIYF